MKVLYDNQIFSMQQFGGISRYFYELIRILKNDIHYSLPIVFSNNHYLQNLDITTFRTFFPNHKFKGRTTIIQLFNYLLQRKFFNSDYDIFHPTYYNPYFLKYIKKKPFVLTIHDLTYEKFPVKLLQNDWTIRGKKILVEKAGQIIAVSENTKKDIVDMLHIEPDKVRVIYHGCSLKPCYEKRMNLPDRFLLFVGERGGYKNFENLAKAFSSLLQVDNELKLVVTGRPFSPDEQFFFKSLRIEKNVIHYFTDNESLAELYSSALAFVYPSVYEGFGIPILEAFTCGCPVILSRSSCFPEIAGNAGVYFDPFNVDSIIESIKSVMFHHSFRNELIEKGKERSKYFSWEKTAKETLKLYQSF
ncbi:MAG: glycosyltransferase family 4 protein [Dysgonamonadaceae bacterium]|jgi:glycosyltransferase involved in cell wall biosynthesis|nr:glycosyltransferase family 4 protein [Dysgonamonadaceae bacterium]